MPKIRTKIFAALMLTLVALVMLVVASVAWFTISTNPEISGMQVSIKAPDRVLVSETGEEDTWEDTLNLSESFGYYAPLKPVSTVDGLHWFLPEYETSGSLKNVNQFELDDELKYANSMIYQLSTTSGKMEKLTGSALQTASNNGYYVYADFFLKSEEDLTDIHLTFANPYAQENTELNDTDGTYVLPAYELEINEDEPEESPIKYTLKNISNDTQNVVRVGFLVNPVYDASSDTKVTDTVDTSEIEGYSTDDYSKNQFYIYEPNSDQRTSVNKPVTSADDYTKLDRYIESYDYKGEKITSGEDTTVIPEDYKNGYYYETLPVEKTGTVDQKDTDGKVIKYKYTQSRLDPKQLIPQHFCQWNSDSLLETMKETITTPGATKWWKSDDVKYPYGSFLNSNSLYNGTTLYDTVFPGLMLSDIGGTGAGLNIGKQTADEDGSIEIYPYDNVISYSSSQSIVTLKKDKPVRIRLFVWLEGQDIDCWNDVAAGGFVVNLELGGITHTDKPAAPVVKAISTALDAHELAEDERTMYNVKFQIQPGDSNEVSRYIYTTNGLDWNEYISESVTKVFAPGTYSIKFKAVTVSGEESLEAAIPVFHIVKAPKAKITFSNDPIDGNYPVGTTITPSVPEGTFSSGTMSIYYSTDDGTTWTPYTSPIVMSAAGSYSYQFKILESSTGSSNTVEVSCTAAEITVS